jgi:hypothetical protein
LRKLFALIYLVPVSVLLACTTTPVRPLDALPVPADRLLSFQAKPPKDFAVLIVVRDTGFLGSACYCGFYINDILAARFDLSEKAIFYIEPGELTLKVGTDPLGAGLCGIGKDTHYVKREAFIKAGETKTYNLRLLAGGVMDIQRAD